MRFDAHQAQRQARNRAPGWEGQQEGADETRGEKPVLAGADREQHGRQDRDQGTGQVFPGNPSQYSEAKQQAARQKQQIGEADRQPGQRGDEERVRRRIGPGQQEIVPGNRLLGGKHFGRPVGFVRLTVPRHGPGDVEGVEIGQYLIAPEQARRLEQHGRDQREQCRDRQDRNQDGPARRQAGPQGLGQMLMPLKIRSGIARTTVMMTHQIGLT